MHALGISRTVALAALLGVALVLAVAASATAVEDRRSPSLPRLHGEPALHPPTPTPHTPLTPPAQPHAAIQTAVPASVPAVTR